MKYNIKNLMAFIQGLQNTPDLNEAIKISLSSAEVKWQGISEEVFSNDKELEEQITVWLKELKTSIRDSLQIHQINKETIEKEIAIWLPKIQYKANNPYLTELTQYLKKQEESIEEKFLVVSNQFIKKLGFKALSQSIEGNKIIYSLSNKIVSKSSFLLNEEFAKYKEKLKIQISKKIIDYRISYFNKSQYKIPEELFSKLSVQFISKNTALNYEKETYKKSIKRESITHVLFKNLRQSIMAPMSILFIGGYATTFLSDSPLSFRDHIKILFKDHPLFLWLGCFALLFYLCHSAYSNVQHQREKEKEDLIKIWSTFNTSLHKDYITESNKLKNQIRLNIKSLMIAEENWFKDIKPYIQNHFSQKLIPINQQIKIHEQYLLKLDKVKNNPNNSINKNSYAYKNNRLDYQ